MSSSSASKRNWILPANVFERLSATMQEIAYAAGESVLVLTEGSAPSFKVLRKRNIHRFTIVVSQGFSSLLLGELATAGSELEEVLAPEWMQEQYQTVIYFEPDAIVAFLADLQRDADNAQMRHSLEEAIERIQPNNATLQSQFTLRLLDVLVHQVDVAIDSNTPPKSLSDHSEQQAEQDTVFSQVATQIRQTQELSLIIKTSIQQVRSFLQADRVIIYQFESSLSGAVDAVEAGLVCGRITYEDRATPSVPRILNLSEGVQCFIGVPDYREKYCKGAIQAVDDIRATYVEAPCLINLLEWARVKAKLVVPIVVQEELWGLLIAHQCWSTRHWLDSEIRFLRCVAELLAIAIYQTQLNSQLQQQAQTLEYRVVERTQELHDALNAAQTASLAKTEFLASVSHELRTPLTAIIGMATTLLRLPADAKRERFLPPEKQQDYLRIIRKSGEHLLELINDILDLSQVESGRTILDVQEFSLAQIANECLRMLRDKAQHSQLTLTLDLRHNLQDDGCVRDRGDRFAADPRRVRQILLNLLSNAIKFTPEGGQVTLRVWLENGKAMLQVEDTGIGISNDQFPLLFKKFQQLDTSYRRQYEGTGLGLALTKQLVELHGGQIEVESTVNVGSVFTVHLPPQPLKVKSADLDRSPQLSLVQHGRVVLVENSEAIANLICDLLTAAGHQVVWMIDGMTAIQQVEVLKPEALIVDVQLAGMSTGEILRHVRQNKTTHATRIIVLTGEEANVDHWLTEGADDWITLPIEHPEELLNKVTSVR